MGRGLGWVVTKIGEVDKLNVMDGESNRATERGQDRMAEMESS